MTIKNHRKNIIIFTIGTALLLVAFPLDNAMHQFMDSLQNPTFNYLFGWISYIISLIFVLLIITSLFMWEEKKKDWIIPLWFSAAAAIVITYVLKFIVARERPDEIVLWFKDYSFPSAHAAMSFATLPILDEEFPVIKWFWISFAALVALSRVYLGVHFLSDIIAGSLIGYGIGLFTVYLKKKHSIFG